MTAESLIELLKSRGMISEKLAEQLRSRAEQGGPLASPEGILDLLATKDVLTPSQVEEIRHAEPSLSSDLELLEIAPLDELPVEDSKEVTDSGWTSLEGSAPADDDEILELEPLSEDEAFGDPTDSNVLHEGPAARRRSREPEPESEGDGYVPPGEAGAGWARLPGRWRQSGFTGSRSIAGDADVRNAEGDRQKEKEG